MTTKNAKRGRPSLPDHQRKSKMLCARADPKTYADCMRAAKRSGMRFTDWLRDRIGRAAKSELSRASGSRRASRGMGA